jgi:hypothetical protein
VLRLISDTTDKPDIIESPSFFSLLENVTVGGFFRACLVSWVPLGSHRGPHFLGRLIFWANTRSLVEKRSFVPSPWEQMSPF